LFTLWSAFEQLFKIEWKYNSKKFFIDKFSNKREEDYIKNFSAFIKVKCLSKSEVQNLENDLYTLTKDIFSLYEKSYKKKTKTAISFWKSFRTTIIYKDLKDGTRGDLFKENNGKLILNFQKQNSITKFIKLCYYFRNGFAHGYVTPSTLIDSPSDCVKIIKNLHAGLEVISTVVFFKILEEGSK
jgi:hypothetical protein